MIDGAGEIELSGGLASTTNQRMELTGPIEGLRSLPGRRAVAIYSDSAYHDVTWHKVAGHSGHELNDRADALARSAIPMR